MKRREATDEKDLANTNVTAARKNRSFAGAAPVGFRFAKNASRKTSGESLMDLPGFVLIVSV